MSSIRSYVFAGDNGSERGGTIIIKVHRGRENDQMEDVHKYLNTQNLGRNWGARTEYYDKIASYASWLAG